MRTLASSVSQSYKDLLVQLFFPDEKPSLRAQKLPKSAAEWHSFFALAERNRVLCRSLRRLLATFASELSDNQTKIVQKKLNEHRKMYSRVINVINAAQEALRNNNVDFTIFKTFIDYPDIGEDIDVLIAEGDAEKAEKAIQEMKIRPFLSSRGWHGLEYSKKRHFYFNLGDRSFDLELYPGFTLFGEEYVSEEMIIQRSKMLTFESVSALVPSPEDDLLITCVHCMYRHGGLIRFYEILNSTRLLDGKRLDWRYVFEAAHEKGITNGLLCFLYVLNNFCSQQHSKPLLPNNFGFYLENSFGPAKFLNIKDFPKRIPIIIIWLLFVSKFLHDISRSRWSGILRTLQSCVWHTVGRAVRFVCVSTRIFGILKNLGLD